MTDRFAFDLIADATARRASARSPRRAATIRTPAFMPVGTAATVKALYRRPGARPPAPTSCSATPIT